MKHRGLETYRSNIVSLELSQLIWWMLRLVLNEVNKGFALVSE